jgi:hypothetical protein
MQCGRKTSISGIDFPLSIDGSHKSTALFHSACFKDQFVNYLDVCWLDIRCDIILLSCRIRSQILLASAALFPD